jgi:hypothetical protein
MVLRLEFFRGKVRLLSTLFLKTILIKVGVSHIGENIWVKEKLQTRAA